jgi:murein L,D-transpeptidase YafK
MRKRALLLVLVFAAVLGAAAAAWALRPREPLPNPLRNPEIHVFKERRQLELISGGRVVRTYRIGLGSTPVGHKRRQGDRRTPEGRYFICNKNPRSQFYLSLQINYPNEQDAVEGLADGVITAAQHERIVRASRQSRIPPAETRLGGEIFIHGHGSGSDWTWGCIALDDPEMKELFDAIPVGTPVVIVR